MGKHKSKKSKESKGNHSHDDDTAPAQTDNLEDLLLLDEDESALLASFRAEYERELESGGVKPPPPGRPRNEGQSRDGERVGEGKHDDEMLVKFLRAKKWDQKKAMAVLRNYSVRIACHHNGQTIVIIVPTILRLIGGFSS